MPVKALLGQGAGRRAVKGENAAEKAEVVVSFAEWHRHNRNVEIASNDACNVAYRNSIVADGVQSCTYWRAFQRQAEQTRCIKAMHGRPAVQSVTWITRHALRACNADQSRDKTMVVALAMH